MNTPDLQALIELSHRATGGVWRWSENGNIVTDVPDADCDPEIAAVYSEHMDVDASDTSEPANAAFIAALVNWFRSTRAATVPQGVSVDAEDAAWFRWLEKHAYIEFNGDDGNGWVCDASEPMFTSLRERMAATTPPPAELGRGS